MPPHESHLTSTASELPPSFLKLVFIHQLLLMGHRPIPCQLINAVLVLVFLGATVQQATEHADHNSGRNQLLIESVADPAFRQLCKNEQVTQLLARNNRDEQVALSACSEPQQTSGQLIGLARQPI